MKLRALTSVVAILLLSTAATAQEESSPEAASNQSSLDIHALIAKVADELGKEIIVDPRVPPGGRMGYTTKEDADYESLLAILRLNSFATIETDDQILIVPIQGTRSEPTRILQEDDPSVSDYEVVTRLIHVPQTLRVIRLDDEGRPIEGLVPQAPQLVPVLRPMMTQSAQLGAISGTNTLIIVDRYDNVRRITAIIEEILKGLDD